MARFLSEEVCVVSVHDPIALVASTVLGDSIDMAAYDRVIFIVAAGVLGASATVDFSIYGCATSGGSYTTLITGKSIAQMVKASDDNRQAILEVCAGEVIIQGMRYIKGSLTVGTATSVVGVVALGGHAAYQPATLNDLASVAQIVT